MASMWMLSCATSTPSCCPRWPPTPLRAVLPLLHGEQGEDGSLRDVLELLRIPYVGAQPSPCRIAFDKPAAKHIVAAAGLSTPPDVVLPHSTFRELGASSVLSAVVQTLGLPLVVKPTRSGSALGCSVVRSPDELPGAMVGCYAYGDLALLERFVGGTEVAVTVIDTGDGPRALPAVEIVPSSGIYDYQARYTAGETEFFAPARLTRSAAEAVGEVAVEVHRLLGLRDLSRSDVIVDDAGVPWFIEVNVAPGMTETSLLPQAVNAAGLDFGVVLRDLLVQASQRGH